MRTSGGPLYDSLVNGSVVTDTISHSAKQVVLAMHQAAITISLRKIIVVILSERTLKTTERRRISIHSQEPLLRRSGSRNCSSIHFNARVRNALCFLCCF